MFQKGLLKKTFIMLLAFIMLVAQGGLFSLHKVSAEVLQNGVTISAIDAEGNTVINMVAVPFNEGDYAFDVIEKFTLNNGIEFEYDEYDFGNFITNIGGIKFEDYNNYWGFYVNGVSSNLGASAHKVKNGENLLFKVTNNSTNDIKMKVSATGRNGEVIIPETEVTVVEGATAYDALIQAANIHEKSIEATVDSQWLTYLNDIDNYLKENEFFSAYMNGTSMQVGLVSYQVNENDHLELKAESWSPEPTDPSNGGQPGNETPSQPSDPEQPANPIDQKLLQNSIQKALSRVQSDFNGSFYDILSFKALGKELPKEFIDSEIQNVIENEGNYRNVTDLVKKILNLTAAGKDVSDINGINLIDKLTNHERMKNQGNNGLIFALLALDSGQYEADSHALWTRETLKQEILSQQLSSGGWALFGTSPSPDMTGMALAALAPYKDEPTVKSAIDKAVQWLKSMQQSAGTGGFHDELNGGDASESVAQVIVGLSAVGIDPASADFTVNDTNLVQHLLSFQTSDGGFKHVKADSDSNSISTTQGLLALAAYQKYLDGNGSIYQFVQQDQPLEEVKVPPTKQIEDGKLLPNTATNNYEILMYGVILLIVASALYVYHKRRNIHS